MTITHEADKAMAADLRDKLAAFKLAWLAAHTAGLEVNVSDAMGRGDGLGRAAVPVKADDLKPEALVVRRPL